jgi:hypothetical protein
VEALENNTVRVAVAHVVERIHHGSRLAGVRPVWIRESIQTPGSANLENELITMKAGLLNNLEPAVIAFGELVKESQGQR